MLARQQRSGHQNGHLLAILDGLERRAHGNFRLTEAHVAGDQAIHRDLFFHVSLDFVDGRQLIRGLRERERVLELVLPRGVPRKSVTARSHTGRIQLDEFARDFLDSLARLGLGLRPIRAAHLGQARRLPTNVTRELIQLIRGHK